MIREDHFILMYHHVADVNRLEPLRPYVVSPEMFRSQLETIARRGLPVSAVRDVASGSSGQKTKVCITFDDCPRELLETAVPELDRRGWKATFFAVAGKCGGYNSWDVMPNAPRVPLMSLGQLRELSAAGHEIGSHGYSHASLRDGTREAVTRELRESREVLEQAIGVPVTSLSYPYGEAPHRYRELVPDAGYSSACSIFSLSRTVIGDRYAVRRILVTERDRSLRLRAKLSAPYLLARAKIVDPDRVGGNR